MDNIGSIARVKQTLQSSPEWDAEKTRQRRTPAMVHQDVKVAVRNITPFILSCAAHSTMELDFPSRSIIVHLRFSSEQLEEYLEEEDLANGTAASYLAEYAVPTLTTYIREEWINEVAEDVHLRKRWRPLVIFKPLTEQEIREAVGYYG